MRGAFFFIYYVFLFQRGEITMEGKELFPFESIDAK